MGRRPSADHAGPGGQRRAGRPALQVATDLPEPEPPLRALRRPTDIADAVDRWKWAFGQGARDGGKGVFVHPSLPVWGHFRQGKHTNGRDRYWHVFGLKRSDEDSEKVVEINPPRSGVDRRVQGVIARDASGDRWLLHRGRMTLQQGNVSEAIFNLHTDRRRVPVILDNGAPVAYFAVANLDAAPKVQQRQIAGYVAECERIRKLARPGDGKVASTLDAVETAEILLAERIEPYTRGAQDAKEIKRRHGVVWGALRGELTRRGFRLCNKRVGRWGPDLRTLGDAPILFEIKTSPGAADLQRALGQLLLYERLLGGRHQKVLVVPPVDLPDKVVVAFKRLGIAVVRFDDRGKNRIVFARRDLDRVCG